MNFLVNSFYSVTEHKETAEIRKKIGEEAKQLNYQTKIAIVAAAALSTIAVLFVSVSNAAPIVFSASLITIFSLELNTASQETAALMQKPSYFPEAAKKARKIVDDYFNAVSHSISQNQRDEAARAKMFHNELGKIFLGDITKNTFIMKHFVPLFV
jgi:uncharacterized protein YhaN